MSQAPLAEGLYRTEGDVVRLVAGRRRADGRMRFPMPQGAEAERYEAVTLAPEGRLWSFTVQRFRPKTPPYIGDDDERGFKPFALGYVEFPGEVIVEGRIETDDPSILRIGMPMRTVRATLDTATRGVAEIYAFQPADGGDAA